MPSESDDDESSSAALYASGSKRSVPSESDDEEDQRKRQRLDSELSELSSGELLGVHTDHLGGRVVKSTDSRPGGARFKSRPERKFSS